MCDNCKNPRERVNAQEEMATILEIIQELNEQFVAKPILDFVLGNETKEMKDYKFNKSELFGAGKSKDVVYWESVLRHAMLHNLVYKEVEQYGVLHLTEAGKAFIEKPTEMMITLNHNFDDVSVDPDEMAARPAALDNTLLRLLKDVRKSEAKKKNVPPYIIFQDPSLEDMATQYPITMEELSKVSGVSAGKAQKYGKAFIELIGKYVEENEIERPQDFVVKQVANQSKTKVAIIKGIDKKIPLNEIARQNQMNSHELFDELNIIILSGMKLNLNHCIEDIIDEGVQEEIYDYFRKADTDDIDTAFRKLKEDDEELTYEEVQLIRLQFLSDVAN